MVPKLAPNEPEIKKKFSKHNEFFFLDLIVYYRLMLIRNLHPKCLNLLKKNKLETLSLFLTGKDDRAPTSSIKLLTDTFWYLSVF
jgi:hypothetical protein